MRITRVEGHHCIVLADAEAECLVEACALVVLAGQSLPRAILPPHMGALLCSLFEGLRTNPSDVGNALVSQCFDPVNRD
jgi:hypothetical protein